VIAGSHGVIASSQSQPTVRWIRLFVIETLIAVYESKDPKIWIEERKNTSRFSTNRGAMTII
jgi:hypothetical protein